MERREQLTQTPIPKLILTLAVPTIISMLVTALYNTADTYFVGRIPIHATQATAAVGIVLPLMAMIQAIGFFYGQGSGNFLSRRLGAGDIKGASEMAATSFFLALVTGAIIALAGNLCLPFLTRWLASDNISDTTLMMTGKYTRIILLGAPFMIGQFVINNQLRFQGSAIYAMVGLLAGAAVNMALDPLLILLWGLEVRGAAIATVSGQLVGFCILLLGSTKGENLRLNWQNICVNRYYLLELLNGGSPSLFRQGLASVSTMLLNRAAGIWGGEFAIAGMSIVTRVMMLLACTMIGFGQGYQPVCSFNYGAGLKSRVREGYWFCIKWGMLFLSLLAVVCFIFAPRIIWFFRQDDAVVAVGYVALRCQACVLPLSAPIVISNMMLQSIGKGLKASITASARNGIFFIPLILILPQFLGLFGVEITQAAADVLTISITLPLALSELRQMKQERL